MKLKIPRYYINDISLTFNVDNDQKWLIVK